MEYRVIRTGQSDDHFEHALFGGGRQKGAQNKNHKYLARAWWQNKWRYAYTQAEVRMLQNLGKARETAKNVGDKAKAGAAKVTKTVSDVASGKYARDVDSRAGRYAESAAQRSAASKRQSSSARDKQEQYRSASRSAEENRAQANRLVNRITGQSKTYNKAADAADERAERHAAEGSRLMTMSKQSSAGARSDTKKAAEAEAEKNTAAYKISKAAGNASRAARNAADRVSDTARDVGNRVSNAARSAADSVRNSSAGRYVSNTAEARRAEREHDEAAASGNRQAAIDAENRRENAETQRRNAASDARNAVTSVAERGRAAAEKVANRVSNAARGAANSVKEGARDAAENARNAVKETRANISNAAKKAADVATGNYSKNVESQLVKERETAKRAQEDINKQYRMETNALKRKLNNEQFSFISNKAKEHANNAAAAEERARANAKAGWDTKLKAEQRARELENERDGAAYKVSETINNAKDAITNKGKAAVERLLNRASSAVKAVGERATDTANRATDSIDRAVDKVKDAATTAARKAAAQSVKMEYGADSPQYRAAKAQVDYDKAVDDLSEARDKYGVNSSQYKQAMRNEAAAREEKNEALKAAKLDSRKSNSEKAKDRITSAASSASEKGKAAVERLLNRASDAAKSAVERVANTETGRKISDTAERVADRVSDIKESAEHKAYASEMKRKYGADSLHYKDAQALLDHDKAVDDLAKARDKYGVNSSEYKAAMRKEQSTRDAMDEVHEQNLYANNAQYKKISDQASALGSYIDNMDARGGPQTAEGKANYRKMQQELSRLEAELERMWNEDWE